MCEPSPPSASFRAGAITSAKSTGVSSGTRIWRGVRAVRAARRLASVAKAGRAVVMIPPSWSGGLGEPIAGEPQVDDVESRSAGADPAGGQAGAVERMKRRARLAVVERDRERRAHREGVVRGDAER